MRREPHQQTLSVCGKQPMTILRTSIAGLTCCNIVNKRCVFIGKVTISFTVTQYKMEMHNRTKYCFSRTIIYPDWYLEYSQKDVIEVHITKNSRKDTILMHFGFKLWNIYLKPLQQSLSFVCKGSRPGVTQGIRNLPCTLPTLLRVLEEVHWSWAPCWIQRQSRGGKARELF